MSDQAALPEDYAERAAAMPANTWTFRRIFVFIVTGVLLVLLWRLVELMPVEAAPEIAKWLIVLIAIFAVLYLVGPTAEHVVRLGSIVQSIWPFGRAKA
ncbi:hypothetical protein sos41_31470 [Alphaproteobacteria bacterium SO-S41]|nr:hypothetical protein sos41_31470 [Alphaproteobacteria bacterium SO-S41]